MIIGYGNTMSWKIYKSEALKCILVFQISQRNLF